MDALRIQCFRFISTNFTEASLFSMQKQFLIICLSVRKSSLRTFSLASKMFEMELLSSNFALLMHRSVSACL